MDYQVVWTESASSDLDDIVAFISRDDPMAALKWMDAVFDLSFSLSQLPERGRLVPEWVEGSLRELIHGNYRLVYRITNELVEVIAVIHSRQEFYRAFPDQL